MQLAGAGVPPRAQQRQLGVLLRELQIEYSIGYKHLLLAQIQPRSGRINARRLAEVTARLMAALRDVQLACFLTRTVLIPDLWREMHALYAYVQRTRLADSATNDTPAPSLAYRQAVLLSLADPPHMSHAEILFTWRYLDQSAGLAQLGSLPVPTQLGFVIQTGGDTAPSPYTASQIAASLWLDSEALCSQLHATILQLRSGASPSRVGLPPEMEGEFSQSVCIRLFKHWSSGVARTYRRYPTPGRPVQTVAGVGAIHRMLEKTEQAARPESLETDPHQIHIVAPSFTGVAAASTVQWISDARQVELGVERLSPQIQPAWVRPLRGGKLAEPALFVPGLASLRQNARLLVPHHLYQIGMDAEVRHAHRRYMLTFGKRFEHTPSFDLIDFTIFADLPT
ncbi:MAG: hypothetical protein B7X81_14120 [Hydrogenophilales bacterium 17-61-76]|nr:MAG: hypothetical protein B7X81_14120 [Hydrogenophilales bacterium 17-61-76]